MALLKPPNNVASISYHMTSYMMMQFQFVSTSYQPGLRYKKCQGHLHLLLRRKRNSTFF